MTDPKKIEEGIELVKSAEKSLKTTLLKWKPDYDFAADEYCKAATCFKVAKAHEQSKSCLLKAADCRKQNRAFFHAARCLEQAILACRDLNDMSEVGKYAEMSAGYYQQHGSYDAAASVLGKAAKMIEATQPETALRLYRMAADVVSIEDNVREAADYVSKVARILVRLKMYDQAADAVRREIGLHQQTENLAAIGRLAVVLVLVQLARGDTVAAEKAFKEWGNCCEAPEVQTLEMLLQAFDEEDPEEARKALNSSFIKHMDTEYARLARDLPLPQASSSAPKDVVRPNAAPSYVSPNAGTHQDPSNKPAAEPDDEDYDLC